jgi:hypothetical protein
MDNDRAIGDCVLRAESLRRYSEQVENEEFPCAEPIHLARALANVARALAEYLIRARNSPSYQIERSRLEIRAVDGLVKWLFEPLRYAEGAVTSKVPWSLVGPLQGLSSRLLPDTTIILRPKWRYNYAVLMSDIAMTVRKAIENVLPPAEIDDCFRELKPPLHIISFPYIERRAVFLHAALGHEIGHLLAEEFIRKDKATMPNELAMEIVKAVQADQSIGPLFKPVETIRRLRECAEYRKRAIQELGSDMVAVNLMGPAALFALDGIIGMRNLDDIPSVRNERYPPRRYRIRIMLKELQDHLSGLVDWSALSKVTLDDCRHILEAYEKRIKELQSTATATDDARTLKTDKTVDIAYRWVDLSLASVAAFVRSQCKDISEVSESFRQGKEDLGKGTGFWRKACNLAHSRLERGLPPNTEDDTNVPPQAATVEAIMNAGWLHLLSSISPRPADVAGISDFVEQYQRAERLTLRALELADVQAMYSRWRHVHERAR